jgi:hypothetical protein
LRRAALILGILLLAARLGAVYGQEAAQTPDEAPASGESSPRELLDLFGIDESFFAGFKDDAPVESELEKLASLLYRLRRIPRQTLEEHAQPLRIVLRAEDRNRIRGEIVDVSGYVRRATRVKLPEALAAKYEFDACYRCEMMTHLGAVVTVYVSSVPSAWELDAPIAERGAALGTFVKMVGGVRLEGDGEETAGDRSEGQLMFAADRFSWHPDVLLGRLGMDFSLFEGVSDRTGLDERECFYRMLAAVHEAEAGRIERAGRAHLAERREFLERLARNRELGPKRRAAAERELARVETGADDVVPLFNDPAAQRGKLFVLPGEALRAIEVRVDDPDIVKRFGIDHYYEVEIVTADSQNNPIVCCVAELPPNMPLGESIHENVRVTGFFLKSWAYETPESSSGGAKRSNRQQLAPLVLAKSVEVLGDPVPEPTSPVWAIAVAAAVVVFAAAAWFVKRGDFRARARLAESRQAPPEGWPDAAGDST